MAKIRWWDWVSGGSTVWGLLPATWQTAATTALSAATAYLGYQAGGLFYALLGGAAMFALGMAGAYYTILFNRQTSIFERLGLDRIAPIQAGITATGSKEAPEFSIHGLTLEVQLQNHSERNVWIKIKRSHHSIAGQTNEGPVSDLANIIPPHGDLKIVLETLPDIKIGTEQINGSIDMEILYGPDKDDLRYLFSYVSKPAMGVLIDTHTGVGQLSITSPITKYEHVRL